MSELYEGDGWVQRMEATVAELGLSERRSVQLRTITTRLAHTIELERALVRHGQPRLSEAKQAALLEHLDTALAQACHDFRQLQIHDEVRAEEARLEAEAEASSGSATSDEDADTLPPPPEAA